MSSDSWSEVPVASDFTTALGKEIQVYFKRPEELKALNLPLQDGAVKARLVGLERIGIWIEPPSEAKGGAVPHFYVPWDNVLTVVQYKAVKKEYRGLRPV